CEEPAVCCRHRRVLDCSAWMVRKGGVMASTDSAATGLIVRNPQILEGEPTIAGTRISVRAVVLTHRYTPDVAGMLQAHPMLSEAAIRAALSYYADHQQEIDRYIAENEDELD